MKQKLLVILGSTSTGKTELAIDIAKKLNGEIVSADSRQVYKYLDIGTGKLPGDELSVKGKVLRKDGYWIINEIKIWMYDVAEPDEQSSSGNKRFNLYQFILKAQEFIEKISTSGKLPTLVGGTGLYIRGLLEGLSEFETDEDYKLRTELETLEIDEIRNKINPESLKILNNSEINNKRRLIRLYEKLINGNPRKKSFSGIENDFDVLKIGLKTDRKILRERIRQRVLERIDQGMIEESKKLLAEEILAYDRMEELGLEYRYIAKFLKGIIKTEEELIEIISLKIGQFAKRQETWFRKEKGVVWFDISKKNFKQQVEKQILDWYNSTK